MKTAINNYNLKLDTAHEIITHKLNKVFLGKEKANELKYFRKIIQFKKNYFCNKIWNFKGVKLPDYKPDITGQLMYYIYLDSLFVYCQHNDNYDNILIDQLDNLLPEGTYCYKNNDIDVTVKKKRYCYRRRSMDW